MFPGWTPGLLLIIAVVLTYTPVGWAGFIWDDDSMIVRNGAMNGLPGLWQIWTTAAADVCPLTLTTFWIEHALWGLNPLPYHLVNVALHAGGAVVLWRVLLRLKVPGAWLGAAIWALHPVQVESVAWVAETKNTESGLFFLLSILLFLRWIETKERTESKERNWPFALAFLFGAMAMASKSSTVILPVVLCLCAGWMERRWDRRSFAATIPFFVLALAAGLISVWTQGTHFASAHGIYLSRSWLERIVTAGQAIWFYLGKLLWPFPLVAIYPRWSIDAGRWTSYLPWLGLAIALFIFWRNRRTWSGPWLFASAYFLVALLPVVGFLNLTYQLFSWVADHFQYLASMGPAALAGAGIVRIGDLRTAKGWLVPAALVLFLAAMGWRQAWIYRDSDTLWNDTLAKNPNCWLAYNRLASHLLEDGKVDEAIAYFQKTLQLQIADKYNPYDAEAHDNLGIAYAQKEEKADAIAEFKEAIALNPDMADAHYNLGLMYAHADQFIDALAELQKAHQLNPGDAEIEDSLEHAAVIVQGK
jgi:hypothetical protein